LSNQRPTAYFGSKVIRINELLAILNTFFNSFLKKNSFILTPWAKDKTIRAINKNDKLIVGLVLVIGVW